MVRRGRRKKEGEKGEEAGGNEKREGEMGKRKGRRRGSGGQTGRMIGPRLQPSPRREAGDLGENQQPCF